jgi:hypothetical protein
VFTKEHRLREFEDRVVRRIIGSRKEGTEGGKEKVRGVYWRLQREFS